MHPAHGDVLMITISTIPVHGDLRMMIMLIFQASGAVPTICILMKRDIGADRVNGIWIILDIGDGNFSHPKFLPLI